MPTEHHRAGRPPSNTVEQRRDELLATALDLFIERGFAEVSLAMVAQAAHVAIRTIHVKFGGKDELLRAIIAANAAAHSQQLAALRLDGLSFRARLERLANHLWQRCNDPRLRKLQAMVFAHADQALADAWRVGNPGLLARVAQSEFLRADMAFAEGMTPELLWEHFLNCICGSHAILGPVPATDQQRRVSRALTLFMNAVAARPAAADTTESVLIG